MTLPDHDVRDRIATDLDTTLFVDAGAGSGKTTVLVQRVVNLVRGGVPMRHIAAVTFTEKAASELRDRLREKLEEIGDEAALAELDGAALGTLHSFARRVLSEHPIEAALPPLIDVLDEVGSQVAADRHWNDLRIELLDDRDVAPLIRLALAADMKLDQVRELVATLEANWDMVEERLADTAPPPPPQVDVQPYVRRARAILERRRECTDQSDGLLERFTLLAEWVRLAADADDDAQLLDLVDEIPTGSRAGKASAWGGQAQAIRAEMKALSEDGKRYQKDVVDGVLRCLIPRLARDVLDAAERRRASGSLRFHDLLVLARRLVRTSADARASLHYRYRRLLLDEAQDTDPIQVELAVRIAGGRGADGAVPWTEVDVPAGSLFFVGDAKQSIYRFRRADIQTYLAAQATLGETLALTTNFRSSPEVLAWVNAVFGRLVQPQAGVQPTFRALDVAPGRAAGSGSVTTLGRTASDGSVKADAVRDTEARDVAHLVVTALEEKWPVSVRQGDSRVDRAIQPDDITILLPFRTAITALEGALDRFGVPYRTEAASIVYSAPEVRELLTCLRAVDDPTDELAVVATLRSSLFGCSDRELWRWRSAGGSWNLFARHEPDDNPVGAALDQLRTWSRARSRHAPSELLEDILHQRRMLEAVVDGPRFREVWRRLRFVVDQARAWSEAERGSLREYLSWAARQADDSARVTETVLPETDTRTVRITTIHASKGLEFPFVIVAGLSSPGSNRRPTALWPSRGSVEVQLSAKLRTAGYDDVDTREKEFEYAERLRLLYVACTRAESHLAVSVHRTVCAPDKEDINCVPAEVLARASFGVTARDAPAPLDREWELGRTADRPVPSPSWEEWSRRHALATDRSGIKEAVSATMIAHGEVELASFPPGLKKDPIDLELPPWVKGRYGTAAGRAVHGVLQTIDLATGAGLRELAESQALAEGVADAVDDIAAAVRSALDADLIRRAAVRPHWRETYVGTVVDGSLVEGYIDLLFRDDDGLVVVDYKTDAAFGAESVAVYRRQIDVYRHALSDVVDEPVVRSVLLAIRPDNAIVL